MMTLEQVQDALYDRRLSVVAKETDLSYDTVWRVRNGNVKQVSYGVIKVLSDYLAAPAQVNNNG